MGTATTPLDPLNIPIECLINRLSVEWSLTDSPSLKRYLFLHWSENHPKDSKLMRDEKSVSDHSIESKGKPRSELDFGGGPGGVVEVPTTTQEPKTAWNLR